MPSPPVSFVTHRPTWKPPTGTEPDGWKVSGFCVCVCVCVWFLLLDHVEFSWRKPADALLQFVPLVLVYRYVQIIELSVFLLTDIECLCGDISKRQSWNHFNISIYV